MEEKDNKDPWISVDHTNDPTYFLDYLDTASAVEFVQLYKRETYNWLKISEGDSVLDVGCGTGDDVLALASIVGGKGRVVGIDNSETLIVEAKNRAEGVGGHVDFQVKDAHDLDFADNTFDACRADRVFQHLEKPEQALSEMVRVARRGACIVVSEPDWETFVVDMPNRTLTRKILNYFCDEHQNGWCGRGLYRLFNEAGLLSISIVARTMILTDLALADQLHELRLTADKLREAGELTATEADEWSEYLKSSSKAGQFFCAVTGFAASGCKPT